MSENQPYRKQVHWSCLYGNLTPNYSRIRDPERETLETLVLLLCFEPTLTGPPLSPKGPGNHLGGSLEAVLVFFVGQFGVSVL